jgi:predicted RNase H-like HicB family nuclease
LVHRDGRRTIEVRPSVRLRIVYEPSDEGGYTADVPALPGCISEGDTLEEARRHIREAIDLYLEPIEDEPLADGVVVEELAV